MKQCSGERRFGGAFTFGPVVWRQCENTAIAMLTVRHSDKTTQELPACAICWQECLDTNIEIVRATPIPPDKEVTA